MSKNEPGSGNSNAEETQNEIDYLDKINRVLNTAIMRLESSVDRDKADLLENRKIMQEENKPIRGFDDLLNLSVANQFVSDSENKYQINSLALNNLIRMRNSPYFGRIDFTEDGPYHSEKIYIGMNSLYDEKDFIFYVYDWRAPISSMYYDYGLGNAGFGTPDGEITGVITKKRQYKIVNGAMQYMFDSDLAIDDDILKYELSKPSAAALKPVINSIQKTQNAAIRRDRLENLIVYGIAGSGKTTVGLHRLAYLLYKYRGSLTSGYIRIFSNNNIFISYISNIIPELGEENIPMLDFNDLIETHMKRKLKFKDMYEQIDFLTDKEELSGVRARGIKLKYSKAFLEYIIGYIRSYTVQFYDINFYDWNICGAKELDELYKERTSFGDIRSRTGRVLDYLNQKFDEFINENIKSVVIYLNQHNEDYLSETECLQVFENFRNGVVSEITGYASPSALKIYGKILKGYCASKRDIYRHTFGTLDKLPENPDIKVNFEDILVIFYIEILNGDVIKNKSVKHILIDEAQDLCPLQHKIIISLYPESRFTVLYDENQALYPLINVNDKDGLMDIYTIKQKRPAVAELIKSYRQTFELSKFASRILGIFSEDKYFNRHGEEPEIRDHKSMDDEIVSIIKEVNNKNYHSVGILTEHKHEAASLYDRVKSRIEAVLITETGQKFAHGAVVMPIMYAKGLEFDAVIIINYNKLLSEDKKNILYLMCTRALHLLYLL